MAQVVKTKPKTLIKENPHLAVYKQAKMYGDIGTVISSLNYLIVSEPVKYKTYADTLAEAYLNAGYYGQCNNLASILLTESPEKESLQVLKATALRQLQINSLAAEMYQKLYLNTKKYRYGLELIQLQLGLQRLAECELTIGELLKQDIKDSEKIAVPKKDRQSTQEVTVKSFIYYVQGLAYNLAKNNEKAIKSFEKALESDKTFELATASIDALKAPKEDTTKAEADIKK
jgi:tetratricopeptide (TPR) repeat protein